MLCMRRRLQTALDNITSSRSTPLFREQALNSLEKIFADAVLSQNKHAQPLEEFLSLQDAFQCNVASRIVGWLPLQLVLLETTSDKQHDEKLASNAIAANLVQALSLVQGTALIHNPTKGFLSSRYCMEILLDLLVAARHLAYQPSATDKHKQDPPLASSILDTLLCILVDAPKAIREFEAANGVEVVVKLLKKAGIPRDIRMKCLEFLYFYLMDETSRSVDDSKTSCPEATKPPTRSTSPVKNGLPRLLVTTNPLASSTSRTPSDESSRSLSPTPTLACSPPHSPTKPNSQHKSLAMLRKDVDFVPLSPKKTQIANLGIGRGAKPITPIKFRGISSDRPQFKDTPHARIESPSTEKHGQDGTHGHRFRLRTTEEKKKILGQLLGNVDALVEGVRQAGIWGLDH